MKLYYGNITYTSAASGADANYPHTNLLLPSVVRGWRATPPPTAWVQATAPTAAGYYLGIQALTGATGGSIMAGNFGPTSSYGTFAGHSDGSGRTKALAPVFGLGFGTLTVFRLTFAGATAKSLGALYLFSDVLTLPDALLRSEVATVYPQNEVSLPNGVNFVVDRGVPRAHVSLRWRRSRADDVEQVARIARAGICWLDLEIPNAPWMQWPVRLTQSSLQRQFATATQDEIALEFTEVA